jgi:AcrR family transcriptional regulator
MNAMTGLSNTRPLLSFQQEIKDAAWQQIAESGVSSLSLKSIARHLKLESSDLDSYFPDLAALMTALVIDAYSSFGDYQISASDSFPQVGQFLQRLMATGIAYREWALRYPERYVLLFGPAAHGPRHSLRLLRPFVLRSFSPLVSVIRELRAGKLLNVDALPLLDPPALGGIFWQSEPLSREDQIVYTLALLIRSRLHGVVSLEIAGQLPPYGDGSSSMYEFEIKSIVRQFVDI